MRAQSRDTPIEVEMRQIAMLAEAGPARRLALALSLSAGMNALSRQAIRERHPELSDGDVRIEFVRLAYGSHLGDAVAAYVREQASR